MLVISLNTGGTAGNVGSCSGVDILPVVMSSEAVPDGVSGWGWGSRAMLSSPR